MSELKKNKKKAWAIFSKYIRLKGSDNGYNKCCTCGVVKHWKELQAGHFIPGRSNSILFVEDNVHPQCRRCNYNEGNGPEYFAFMETVYGRERIDELRSLRHKKVKFTAFDYKAIHDEYKKKFDDLVEELGE